MATVIEQCPHTWHQGRGRPVTDPDANLVQCVLPSHHADDGWAEHISEDDIRARLNIPLLHIIEKVETSAYRGIIVYTRELFYGTPTGDHIVYRIPPEPR